MSSLISNDYIVSCLLLYLHINEFSFGNLPTRANEVIANEALQGPTNRNAWSRVRRRSKLSRSWEIRKPLVEQAQFNIKRLQQRLSAFL